MAAVREKLPDYLPASPEEIERLPKTPRELRQLFRSGEWTRPTTGLCIGYTNVNVAIIPKSLAYDFLVFCQRNPRPCPLLEVLEPGDPIVKDLAPGMDMRTDMIKYRVFEHGELVEEPADLGKYWRDDLVTCLFGCSTTFEGALLEAGIRPTWREGRRHGAFDTNLPCKPAGRLSGPMVVSMRPIPAHQVDTVVRVTSRFPMHHGAPIHIGDPAAIGIRDINKPDYGGSSGMQPGEVPVFWACGVTPQAVARACKPEIMITHASGYMFITDVPSKEQEVGG